MSVISSKHTKSEIQQQAPNSFPHRSVLIKQNTMTRKNKAPELADVTPELAASIVKHMVLPMFDARFKRESKMAKQGGVFSELKLSDQLNQNLTDLSQRFDDLQSKQEYTQEMLNENQKELK